MKDHIVEGLANVAAGIVLTTVAAPLAVTTLDGAVMGISSGMVMSLGFLRICTARPNED